MSEPVQIALIGALVTIISGLFALLTVFLTRKHLRVQDVVQAETKVAIAEVHDIVNSQRTEMLAAIALLKAEVARLNVEDDATPESGPGVTSQHGNVEVTPAVVPAPPVTPSEELS